MKNSLSVILPIHNAQNSLSGKVEQLLDVLCDLTSEFEIVIVDDASTDSTGEVADELSRRYPQIKHLESGERLGVDQSLQMGRQAASGHKIFMHDGRSPMQIDALARQIRASEMMQAVADSQLSAVPGGPQAIDDGLVERLMHWGDALRRESTRESDQMSGTNSEESEIEEGLREIQRTGEQITRVLDSPDAHGIPTKMGRPQSRLENQEKGEFWF